jgi:Holliday junction resolvase RusA-like endonuclease
MQSNVDVLVGVFEDKDGKNSATDGFIVLNYSDPYYSTKGDSDNVVLTFDNATHALVYKDGKQYVAQLNDGVLSLYLESGEGVFVIPFVQ